jgi:hypothetical protein
MPNIKKGLFNPCQDVKSHNFSKLFTFFLLLGLLVFPFPYVQAAEVTLAWDPVDSPELAGYQIYYGSEPGNYQWVVDVGNITSFSLGNLTIGATYYSAATAYTTTGQESGFSNEVSFTVPECTYALSSASASFSSSGGTGSTSVTTSSYCNWSTASGVSWVTLPTPSGLGSATLTYTVAPNTTTVARTAALTIAGNVLTITQAGIAPAIVSTYTITASASSGGTISPSGTITVSSGTSKTYRITPANRNFKISRVVVDGTNKGAISSYTFTNITAKHTISAYFVRK